MKTNINLINENIYLEFSYHPLIHKILKLNQNMKLHTTNYTNTLIEVAEDCPVDHAQIPPEKKEKTLANLQYEKLIKSPYQYTSDDIIFECYAIKNDISEMKREEREKVLFQRSGMPPLLSPSQKIWIWISS
jgi:hypothetical protein